MGVLAKGVFQRFPADRLLSGESVLLAGDHGVRSKQVNQFWLSRCFPCCPGAVKGLQMACVPRAKAVRESALPLPG